MNVSKITERFQNFECPELDKNKLHAYLFNTLAKNKCYKLKRQRVMITEEDDENKFIILDIVKTVNENQACYSCPKCFPMTHTEFLAQTLPVENLKTCIHTQLCALIWGDGNLNIEDEMEDDEYEDLVEVVEEKPKYFAVIHPSCKNTKGPGVVVLTSKTFKPKCTTCQGGDSCLHLRIHHEKFKQQSQGGSQAKRLRMDRVEPMRPQKKDIPDGDLDPFQYVGPKSNVFGVEINFLQADETVADNRNDDLFKKDVFAPEYDPSKVCEPHQNKFAENIDIICVESVNIIIHHTKEVDCKKKMVLYRPTVPTNNADRCDCKEFYTGKNHQLLRVSATKSKMCGKERTLHFVSYEFYFKYLMQLVTGGETLTAFVKSQKMMNQVFFGFDKTPEHKKILQKGWEIFCHSLRFPEDANYCYECPQELDAGENEDDYKDEIEYTIVDGIQMGNRTNDSKEQVKEEFFKEQEVENAVVTGIESKERTFINSSRVRSILGNLVDNKEDPLALSKAVDVLSEMNLNENSMSVLVLLKRIHSQFKMVPDGYTNLLKELQFDTPISALMVPYSSNRAVYKEFMEYLKQETNIFSSAIVLERFINSFPVILDWIKLILKTEETDLSKPFLPPDVAMIIQNMIKLRFEFDQKSRKVAHPRTKPNEEFREPLADFFPNYQIHTMRNVYKADRQRDTPDSDDCDKNFKSSKSITGGIATVSCNHKITKGFRAIRKGESPVDFCQSIFRRLPGKVKAHKRVIVYDFACKMHKVCLRRYPYRIRRFQFVIDRHHQSNHVGCSQAYNIDKYPEMREVNTQIAEQLNNSLRKLSTVVAYSNFQTYLKIIQIFITIKNLKIKKVL